MTEIIILAITKHTRGTAKLNKRKPEVPENEAASEPPTLGEVKAVIKA